MPVLSCKCERQWGSENWDNGMVSYFRKNTHKLTHTHTPTRALAPYTSRRSRLVVDNQHKSSQHSGVT